MGTKKKILAGTALTALAAVASSAQAEEPVSLLIGGYYIGAAGFTVGGDDAILYPD